MGVCALCLKDSVLRDSHLIPKSAYRAIGKNKHRKQPPVLIFSKEKLAISSDAQVKKYLLCSICEQKLSDKENIVAKYWYRGSGFLLRNQLRQMRIYSDLQGQRYFDSYPPVKLSEDDCFYFFVSILWRASMGPWPKYEGLKFVNEEVMEEIRTYLLGVTPPPEKVKVIVWVDWDGLIQAMLTLPMKDSTGNFASLLLLGMYVEIHVMDGGSDISALAARSIKDKVLMVLDKRRCRDVYERVARVARGADNRKVLKFDGLSQ